MIWLVPASSPSVNPGGKWSPERWGDLSQLQSGSYSSMTSPLGCQPATPNCTLSPALSTLGILCGKTQPPPHRTDPAGWSAALTRRWLSYGTAGAQACSPGEVSWCNSAVSPHALSCPHTPSWASWLSPPPSPKSWLQPPTAHSPQLARGDSVFL